MTSNKKRFKKVYVEITNVCNMNCNFCHGTSRKPEFMREEDFSLILGRLKNYTDYIYFHIMGEPMMHPHFSKFIDICGRKGFRVNITTNGSLLHKCGDFLLSPYIHRVNISVHSFGGNEGAASFDEYLDSVIYWAGKINDEGHARIFLRLWNYGQDSDAGVNKVNDLILRRLEKAFGLNFGLENMKDNDLAYRNSSGQSIKLKNKIHVSFADRFSWPDMSTQDFGSSGYCLGLKDQLGILVDGTVVPCCLDSEGTISLGNIFYDNMDDILNGERARRLKEGFSRGVVKEELCRRCQFRTRFD